MRSDSTNATSAIIPCPAAALEVVWSDDVQRERSLAGLLEDGLVEARRDGSYALPGI